AYRRALCRLDGFPRLPMATADEPSGDYTCLHLHERANPTFDKFDGDFLLAFSPAHRSDAWVHSSAVPLLIPDIGLECAGAPNPQYWLVGPRLWAQSY